MEAHTFFLHLLIILLTARIFAELAVRLQAPPVIGELLAGVILGPSLLGWLELTEVIKLLAEVGIILLLFEVGLGTDMMRLVKTGRQSMTVALAGFVFPFILGFFASYFIFHLNVLPSLFIGGTMTATSIGITVRVMADLNRQQSPEGRIVLGAAVLDDVLGVVLLSLIYEFSMGGGVSLSNAGRVILFIGFFFILAPVAAKLLSLIIKRCDEVSEIPGLIPTTIVSLVLFFAWLAQAVGAPDLLGGFAAGLALSRRFFLPFGAKLRAEDPHFTDRIEEQMRPIVRLFSPIFFVMVGLSLNLKEVDWSSSLIWTFSLTLFVLAVLGKLLAGWLIAQPWPARWAIGLAMVPRGEVGLIFCELGYISGILHNDIHAGMVLVIAFTTLLSPFAMKGFYRKYGQRLVWNG